MNRIATGGVNIALVLLGLMCVGWISFSWFLVALPIWIAWNILFILALCASAKERRR